MSTLRVHVFKSVTEDVFCFEMRPVFHLKTHIPFQVETLVVFQKYFKSEHVTRFVLNVFQKCQRKSVSISVSNETSVFYSVHFFAVLWKCIMG